MADNIGTRVRKLRKSLNLTQAELAERIGYDSKSTISSIEGGKSITDDTLRQLAKALKTTIAFLVGETDNSDPCPNNGQIGTFTDDEMKVVWAYRNASELEKKGIMALLNANVAIR